MSEPFSSIGSCWRYWTISKLLAGKLHDQSTTRFRTACQHIELDTFGCGYRPSLLWHLRHRQESDRTDFSVRALQPLVDKGRPKVTPGRNGG
jgi:hypothetical protein